MSARKKMSFEKGELANLLLSLFGHGVSAFGHQLYAFAAGLYVLMMTGSAQSFGITVCVAILPHAILGPFVGALADRMSKKLLIVGSDTLNGLLLLGVFLYSFAGPVTPVVIYGMSFLMSIISTFLHAAFMGAGPSLVRSDNLPVLASFRSAMTSIIQVIAPILGGMVYLLVDIKVFFLAAGVMYLLSALQEMFIDYHFNDEHIMLSAEAAEERGESLLHAVGMGLRYAFTSRVLLLIMGFSMLLNFCAGAFDVLLPFSLLQVLGVSEQVYGFIMGVLPAGALIAAFIVARKKMSLSRHILCLGTFTFGAAIMLFALPLLIPFGGEYGIAAYMGLVMLVNGVFMGIVNITAGVFLQTVVPVDYLGRIAGVFNMAGQILLPISVLFFGFLADHVSPAVILVAVGTIVVFISLLVIRARILDEAIAAKSLHARKAA